MEAVEDNSPFCLLSVDIPVSFQSFSIYPGILPWTA